MTPKPPPMPKPPAPPKSPIDSMPQTMFKPDSTATAYKSLISTSPVGITKSASTAKKTLLGGAK